MSGNTILVVDDQLQARQEIGDFLSEAGYTIIEAEDGKQGLSQMERHGEEVCLILADYHMPIMNGMEMVETLKAQGSKVPIFMVTTEMNFEIKARGRRAGLLAWIQKPVNLPMLLKTLKAMGIG